jgi:hypothetical protein
MGIVCGGAAFAEPKNIDNGPHELLIEDAPSRYLGEVVTSIKLSS